MKFFTLLAIESLLLISSLTFAAEHTVSCTFKLDGVGEDITVDQTFEWAAERKVMFLYVTEHDTDPCDIVYVLMNKDSFYNKTKGKLIVGQSYHNISRVYNRRTKVYSREYNESEIYTTKFKIKKNNKWYIKTDAKMRKLSNNVDRFFGKREGEQFKFERIGDDKLNIIFYRIKDSRFTFKKKSKQVFGIAHKL